MFKRVVFVFSGGNPKNTPAKSYKYFFKIMERSVGIVLISHLSSGTVSRTVVSLRVVRWTQSRMVDNKKIQGWLTIEDTGGGKMALQLANWTSDADAMNRSNEVANKSNTAKKSK